VLAPEPFPRTDGTTYVYCLQRRAIANCPTRVAPNPSAIERLEAMCGSISPVLAWAQILARQACYRPVTRDGLR
jgi:glycine/D-amino acid oxidase-like deaminating enzyme